LRALILSISLSISESAHASETELVIAGLIGSSRATGRCAPKKFLFPNRNIGQPVEDDGAPARHREFIPLSLRFSLGMDAQAGSPDIVTG
jgi:hypothetical protein